MNKIHTRPPRVLIVGCGNMGGALINGYAASYPDIKITVIDTDIISASFHLHPHAGLQIAGNAELIGDRDVDLLVFAVKPQMLSDVMPLYTRFIWGGAMPVSIAAGISVETIRAFVPPESPVIRAMPNLPAKTREGVTVLYADGQSSMAGRKRCEMFFDATGQSLWVEREAALDATTAISGSGPAYFFAFVECLSRAAVDLGLPSSTAKQLARQTFLGAASLLRASELDPLELKRAVCSTGGTTEAALKILEGDQRLMNLLGEAVNAANARSRELSELYG